MPNSASNCGLPLGRGSEDRVGGAPDVGQAARPEQADGREEARLVRRDGKTRTPQRRREGDEGPARAEVHAAPSANSASSRGAM